MGFPPIHSPLYGLLVLSVFLGLTGCQTHNINRSVQPDTTFPATFSTPHVNSSPVNNSRPWWLELQRPALNRLIAQALNDNFDVAQAVSRVRQAQALVMQTRSGRWPQIDLRSSAAKEWERGDGQPAEYDIGGVLQWEVDTFNRIGAAVEADALETQARIEDVAALRLSLSAEIANNYFGAVAEQRRLELLDQQVRTDETLLDLLQLRFEQGVGTRVEVLQQKSRVADSQSLIPSSQADLRVFENRLDVLIGRVPDGQNRVRPSETLGFDEQAPALGVPADLLLNRPDLRAIRAELIAADADIGAAIADRLPRIVLNGSVLVQDRPAFTGPVSMIMGTFVQPLLDWGRRKAVVESNRALYEERLASFTQQYLEAVEEVENALYQEQRQREFVRRLDQRRQLLQETVDETGARYIQGVDDYLPVLNALQELREVERDLISERLAMIQFRIALYRAVGGPLNTSLPQETL